MGIGLLGGGLGMAGAGLVMNQFGSDPMAGVNRDINSQYRGVAGDPGSAGAPPSFFGSKRYGQRAATPGRAAPQAGPAAVAQTSGFRDNQQELITRLEALSKGQGPSLAAEQLRQATDRNMKQQASIAQSGRGNAALAGIQASNTAGALGAQSASDSAVARIAEQQMALQQLGSAINQGRTSDQDLSQFNALQKNYRDQFNVEAQLRARGLDDEQIRALLQMRMAAAQAKQQGSIGNQLMAGGAGLLSMYGSQQKGSK